MTWIENAVREIHSRSPKHRINLLTRAQTSTLFAAVGSPLIQITQRAQIDLAAGGGWGLAEAKLPSGSRRGAREIYFAMAIFVILFMVNHD